MTPTRMASAGMPVHDLTAEHTCSDYNMAALVMSWLSESQTAILDSTACYHYCNDGSGVVCMTYKLERPRQISRRASQARGIAMPLMMYLFPFLVDKIVKVCVETGPQSPEFPGRSTRAVKFVALHGTVPSRMDPFSAHPLIEGAAVQRALPSCPCLHIQEVHTFSCKQDSRSLKRQCKL